MGSLKKVIKIPHNSKRIQLRGIRTDLTKCVRVSPHKSKGLLKKKSVTRVVQVRSVLPTAKSNPSECMMTDIKEQLPTLVALPPEVPPEIQSLVPEYDHLFDDPATLPPSRTFDHRISLLPGAQPVNIRPYRYAPHQKTEIEKQVTKMLQRGIIQHSMSSFASPMLLVKKKDSTW